MNPSFYLFTARKRKSKQSEIDSIEGIAQNLKKTSKRGTTLKSALGNQEFTFSSNLTVKF